MRRTLSILIAALALGACQDAVAPAPDASPVLTAIPQLPGESDGLQSLSASINGPSAVGNYTTCTFTSSVSGGTPPYSYLWVIPAPQETPGMNPVTHAFDTAGTYPYHCEIHDYMHGTVTVVAATETPPSTDTVTPASTPAGSALPWLFIAAAFAAGLGSAGTRFTRSSAGRGLEGSWHASRQRNVRADSRSMRRKRSG